MHLSIHTLQGPFQSKFLVYLEWILTESIFYLLYNMTQCPPPSTHTQMNLWVIWRECAHTWTLERLESCSIEPSHCAACSWIYNLLLAFLYIVSTTMHSELEDTSAGNTSAETFAVLHQNTVQPLLPLSSIILNVSLFASKLMSDYVIAISRPSHTSLPPFPYHHHCPQWRQWQWPWMTPEVAARRLLPFPAVSLPHGQHRVIHCLH